jgi:hypothetical protein
MLRSWAKEKSVDNMYDRLLAAILKMMDADTLESKILFRVMTDAAVCGDELIQAILDAEAM